ncbi:hypothetical protein O0L34_g3428 [Tuta absoluta]|nr:hypothetical protein O0L34_g3428 [Tuta absoluta]
MKRTRGEKNNDSEDDESVARATKRGRMPYPYRPSSIDCTPSAAGGTTCSLRPDDLSSGSSGLMEKVVTEKLEGMVNKYLENQRVNAKSDNIKGDVIIPLFDPDDRENNVFMWLKKINQLGDIYNWNDSKRAYYMQARLDGSARKWYNRLENYDLSWDEWQSLLKKTFPRMFEFSELLEELVSRKKEIKEPMSKYFYDKLAMCHRCKLDDEASVSCIIRGLPSELQASAKALKSSRPENLYCEFLVSLENYTCQSAKNRDIRDREFDDRKWRPTTFQMRTNRPPPAPNSNDRPNTASTLSSIRCYRCNSDSHTVRNCPAPDPRTCNICRKPGHIAKFCRSEQAKEVAEIKIVQNFDDAYFKTVLIEGTNLLGYIDTGAQSNVITLDAVKKLLCNIRPTNQLLRGFTGTQIPALGEVDIKVTIDGILFETSALVTHLNFGRMDLLIGQPVVNRDDVALVVQGNDVNIGLRGNVAPIGQIMVDADSRVDIISKRYVKLLANEAVMLEVEIRGTSGEMISTQPRYFSLAGQEYIIPATVLEGCGGVVKVYNLGVKDVEFKAGDVVVRGQSCSEVLGKDENEMVSQIFLCFWSNFGESVSGFVPRCCEAGCGYVPSSADESNLGQSSVNVRSVNTSLLGEEIVGGMKLKDIDVGDIEVSDLYQLYEVLLRHRSSFASSARELGLTNLAEMEIKLNSDKPVYRRPYRLSLPELSVVRAKVKELLDAGIIRESCSDFASPIVLVNPSCEPLDITR